METLLCKVEILLLFVETLLSKVETLFCKVEILLLFVETLLSKVETLFCKVEILLLFVETLLSKAVKEASKILNEVSRFITFPLISVILVSTLSASKLFKPFMESFLKVLNELFILYIILVKNNI